MDLQISFRSSIENFSLVLRTTDTKQHQTWNKRKKESENEVESGQQ